MDCPTPDKVRYPTRKNAKLHLRQARGRGRLRTATLRVYRCDCGAFHLGNLGSFVIAGYSLDRQNRRQRAPRH